MTIGLRVRRHILTAKIISEPGTPTHGSNSFDSRMYKHFPLRLPGNHVPRKNSAFPEAGCWKSLALSGLNFAPSIRYRSIGVGYMTRGLLASAILRVWRLHLKASLRIRFLEGFKRGTTRSSFLTVPML